ncbi:unnamed protein product [Fusarium fujikuroi]|nr:unnamed protein product [Fusarium fujikuroi]
MPLIIRLDCGLIFTFCKRRAPYRLLQLSRYNSTIVRYTAKAHIIKRLRNSPNLYIYGIRIIFTNSAIGYIFFLVSLRSYIIS